MRAATIAALFGEGILVGEVVGIVEEGNVLGGVTSIIIAFPTTKVCINMKKFQNIFYAFFAMKYPYLPILNSIFCSYITTSYSIQRKTPILYL